jgi:uncharacterized protein (DUF1330 family)
METARPRSPRENCSRSGNATFCVSSALAPAHGSNYGARNLLDGNDNTAWVEGSGGQGAGDFVVLEFDAPRLVRSLTLRNGYAKNADIFGKNSRIKGVELHFSNGDSLETTLTDQPGEQHVAEPAGQGQMGAARHPLGLSGMEIFRHRAERAPR